MDKEYAQTLIQAVADGKDQKKVADSLLAHLKEEGRMKLLPAILRELKRTQARSGKLEPHIEAASEGEKKNALSGAKAAGIEATHAVVNPSLIKGWRARSANSLVDHSAKRALVDIYQKITS